MRRLHGKRRESTVPIDLNDRGRQARHRGPRLAVDLAALQRREIAGEAEYPVRSTTVRIRGRHHRCDRHRILVIAPGMG